jgi:hypothetical protein
VIASKIVNFLRDEKDAILVYHFCSYLLDSSVQYISFLKSFLHQLLRYNDDLLAHVFEEYILERKSASSALLEKLILTLLTSVTDQPSKTVYVRIILDGLDECAIETQKRLISFLNRVLASGNAETVCKMLVSCQDTWNATKLLGRKSTISLDEEKEAVSSAIQGYALARLNEMRSELQEYDITDDDIAYSQKAIVAKAEGKFYNCRYSNTFTDGYRYVLVGPTCLRPPIVPSL